MYFNGKTYFNQEVNMRVVADQRNPPPRKKGVKRKKVIKKKGGKVDMKKLKSLFGSDIIVKLLLSLVDKKARGPNMVKEGKKIKGMRRRGGANFQAPGQVRKEREKRERQARIAKASIKQPGETDEDVSLRMMKEVIAGDNPAVAAFLSANKIPPELRRLQGNLAVLGEAYFDSKTSAKDKKAIERRIVKQVVEGIGGDVRKDFLTGIEEEEAVAGIKEAVEILKKETGIDDPEKLIQQKDEIAEKLKKKARKKPEKEEQIEKALDGLDVVEELKTTDTDTIEATITDADISNIKAKKRAGGRVKQTPEQVKGDLIEHMEQLNPNLQVDLDNRKIFLDLIEESVEKGKGKSQIKKLIDTQNKRLLAGKLVKPTEQKVKKTRADAGIFQEGAIANQPDAFNITIGATGERKKFDLYEVNRRARFLRDELEKFDNREETKLEITSKNKKQFEKELEGHKVEFRNQLKAKAESRDYDIRPDYSNKVFSPDELAEDVNDLRDDLLTQGFGLPNFKLYKGEDLYAIGQEGLTIKNRVDNTYRYIDFSQLKRKKEIQKELETERKEQKQKRKAGVSSLETATEQTITEELLDTIDTELRNKYVSGTITGAELSELPPRLQANYNLYKKDLDKQKKQEAKQKEGQIVVAGDIDTEKKPGFFKSIFGGGNNKPKKPVIERESETLGFTTGGKEITEESLKQSSATGDYDDIFSALDTIGETGDLLQEKPVIKKEDEPKGLQDFDTEAEYNQYIRDLPQFGSQLEGQGFVIDAPTIKQTGKKSDIEKSIKEERAEIIQRYRDGGELESSEVRKLTKPDRKKIGLLTENEYTELSEKEKKRYDAIKANVEAVSKTRQQVGNYGFLGTLKLPNEMLEQFRKAAVSSPSSVADEPQVEPSGTTTIVEEDIPEDIPPSQPSPRTQTPLRKKKSKTPPKPRGRGRPKGSKNKTAAASDLIDDVISVKPNPPQQLEQIEDEVEQVEDTIQNIQDEIQELQAGEQDALLEED